ncbi:MAG: glutamine amidotransferase [Hyphomicrobiales bacterium]|nr:MAG: glutamine amidotransferase [Hyphomicrobiales bacterium]
MGGLRFLVLDGYARAGREELGAGGMTSAGELYRTMLEAHAPGCTVDIIYPADPGAALPKGAAVAQYDGIAWTGSSLCVYKPGPEVTPQIEFAREAFAAGVPSYGSCWAAQIAAIAAGGQVGPHPQGKEMMFARKIALTGRGQGHPFYLGKPSVFDGFISHDDEVTHLPPGGQLLAEGRYTRVQALSVEHLNGTFWAVQYHPEYDLYQMARLIFCRKDKLVELGFFADTTAALIMVSRLETLHANPSRRDLAWELGLDEDILDPGTRQREVRNWIDHLVIPNLRR